MFQKDFWKLKQWSKASMIIHNSKKYVSLPVKFVRDICLGKKTNLKVEEGSLKNIQWSVQ